MGDGEKIGVISEGLMDDNAAYKMGFVLESLMSD